MLTLLKRLADTCGMPLELVLSLVARVATLPPSLLFPDSRELGDLARERRQELFGRD